jgi:1,4-dihydroxy-2-naphthoate octaprenyltransferase
MDLRKPSGWFFTLLGALLVVAGLLWPQARAPLGEVNVNLYAGIIITVFGGILLWLARRAS